jgi:Leucine-rich repeat (LRR) protein
MEPSAKLLPSTEDPYILGPSMQSLETIGNLTGLTWLRVVVTDLSNIPTGMSRLVKLEYLDLSENRLYPEVGLYQNPKWPFDCHNLHFMLI